MGREDGEGKEDGEKGQGVNGRGEGGLGMRKEYGQREKREVNLCSQMTTFPNQATTSNSSFS